MSIDWRSGIVSITVLLAVVSSSGCSADAVSNPVPDDPSVQVASIDVTPSAATLTAGERSQLTATPRDAAGNPLANVTIAWSSDDSVVAMVDTSGMVTALVVGTATITATSEGQSGSAVVTVTAVPSGATDTLFYDGFESGNLNAWDDRFQSAQGNYEVIEDAALAYEGTRLLRILYRAGVNGVGAMSRFVTPGTRVYARIRLQFEAGWQGMTKFMMIRGSPTQWGSFGVGSQCPDGTDFVLANAKTTGGSPGALRFYTYYVDMAHQPNNPNQCYGNHGVAGEDPNPGPTPMPTYYDDDYQLARGEWHTIELEVQLNTPGESDGWQQLWANGTLVAEWTGMRWRTTSEVLWQAFTLENSRSTLPSQDQNLYVDEVLVASGRP